MVQTHPRTILIAALGGEGGGVLAEWIVNAAIKADLPVQATSVPGVAQRTGATSYYVEMMDAPAPQGLEPVFALVPAPGRVDFLVSSELLETGRLLERGFASPDRTVLISSTSRVYTTAEKMQMGDGRFDSSKIDALARSIARHYVPIDLERLALETGTIISAAMFGALAGAGAFPFARAHCENAIRAGGRGAEASLKGFAAAFAAVASVDATKPAVEPAAATAKPPGGFAGLPRDVRDVIVRGQTHCNDFQDEAYGELYLDRVRVLIAAAPPAEDPHVAHALEEGARRLALWMAYEDIPRVADLKTRKTRFERIRREAEMRDDQLLHVVEYLKPGIEEIAAMLPLRIGDAIMRRAASGKTTWPLGTGINISTTGVFGFWTMRALAQFARVRRSSLRFAQETQAIDLWLAAMRKALASSPAFAGALAEMPRLLKGYGDTHLRGRTNYAAIFSAIVAPALDAGRLDEAAGPLRNAVAAALADPDGKVLAKTLASADRASEPRRLAAE
ncbi:indolepyruvate oxidoreductase subunit beta family protein [Roseiarcaceae bacterium H3SJ34-1]|uniref:indolepyruvate oxidoreductase subunit beta family protein n=1 Tax=Terripilifer ovatus TaxID=3032367 RepID=UPI003AB9B4B7|nr:indolepyruvate oxidoreductase subunit beta family protein [Roseiarcaceae bacterium H3SJ34-1]